jgi:hypothetical protein
MVFDLLNYLLLLKYKMIVDWFMFGLWVCKLIADWSLLWLQDGSLSATGDSVIVIGAASKGIIQRDQQHNVQVYNSFILIWTHQVQSLKCLWKNFSEGNASIPLKANIEYKLPANWYMRDLNKISCWFLWGNL